MERLDGTTVASLAESKAGGVSEEASQSVLRIVDVLGKMIFRDGWFHAHTSVE